MSDQLVQVLVTAVGIAFIALCLYSKKFNRKQRKARPVRSGSQNPVGNFALFLLFIAYVISIIEAI